MVRDLFIRFRRSNAFIYSLAAALALWAVAHWGFGFDREASIANLLLSVEASFATCMLLDLQFSMSAQDRARWDRIERELLDVEKIIEDNK